MLNLIPALRSRLMCSFSQAAAEAAEEACCCCLSAEKTNNELYRVTISCSLGVYCQSPPHVLAKVSVRHWVGGAAVAADRTCVCTRAADSATGKNS